MTAPSAHDFIAIVDALYRFSAARELGDRGLFESAFSSDAVLDFTQPTCRLGVDVAPFEGRQAFADTVFAALGNLDTTHTVTNPRVTAFDGERGNVCAGGGAAPVARRPFTAPFAEACLRAEIVATRWHVDDRSHARRHGVVHG